MDSGEEPHPDRSATTGDAHECQPSCQQRPSTKDRGKQPRASLQATCLTMGCLVRGLLTLPREGGAFLGSPWFGSLLSSLPSVGKRRPLACPQESQVSRPQNGTGRASAWYRRFQALRNTPKPRWVDNLPQTAVAVLSKPAKTSQVDS